LATACADASLLAVFSCARSFVFSAFACQATKRRPEIATPVKCDQPSFCRMIAPLSAAIIPQSFSSAARPFAAAGFPRPVSSSPPAGTCEKWTTRTFFVSAHS
jgi:hypothetical protein